MLAFHERKRKFAQIICNFAFNENLKYLKFDREIRKIKNLKTDPSGKSWKHYTRYMELRMAQIFYRPPYQADLWSYKRKYPHV